MLVLEIEELRCKLFLLEAPELVEANISGVPAVISNEFRVSHFSQTSCLGCITLGGKFVVYIYN